MKNRILLLCSILCLSFILSGCDAKSNANKLATFAEQSFLQQDYEACMKTLREASGLNDLTATISIDYNYDYDYDKTNKMLDVVCHFTFSSDEIDRYVTAGKDSDTTSGLIDTLRNLSEALALAKSYKYTSLEGSVRLKLNWPNRLEITTSSEHKYELIGRESFDVEVDDKLVGRGTMYLKNETKTDSSSTSSASHLPNTARHTDVDAWVCAKNIVKGNLKSPSTANFCSYPDATITHLGNGEYKITGWVEAQNSLGATLRQNFVVTYTATEKGYKNGVAIIG